MLGMGVNWVVDVEQRCSVGGVGLGKFGRGCLVVVGEWVFGIGLTGVTPWGCHFPPVQAVWGAVCDVRVG